LPLLKQDLILLIEKHLQSKLRGQIETRINVVGEIEPDKSGKTPIVKQRVKWIDQPAGRRAP